MIFQNRKGDIDSYRVFRTNTAALVQICCFSKKIKDYWLGQELCEYEVLPNAERLYSEVFTTLESYFVFVAQEVRRGRQPVQGLIPRSSCPHIQVSLAETVNSKLHPMGRPRPWQVHHHQCHLFNFCSHLCLCSCCTSTVLSLKLLFFSLSANIALNRDFINLL